MSLTAEQAQWVAHLARLELPAAELAAYTEQLNAIVGYVDQLQQVNTDGVEPLAHPLDLHDIFRPDAPRPPLPAHAVLANAPARKGEYYGVPAVLD